MDVEILSRLQFALTIMFHYIFPTLSIGLSLLLIIMEGLFLITKQPVYFQMARFWTRVFALTFAMGVATGIVMEFEFGTNWATYSRYVGDVFGSALAAEGIFAFFLESGFLAILLFGWNKVGIKFHFFSTVMVALGAHFSAVWIVVANSWMQTPSGFHIVGAGLEAHAEITDFWQMVFNPSSMERLAHTIIGCWLAGAFLVISVSAYYLLKGRHFLFAEKSLKIAVATACVAITLQMITGDISARGVARNQPAKLAAMEGLYATTKGASLSLFGLPNSKEQRIDYEVSIPKMLSIMAFHDLNAEVIGLDRYPRADWPNVSVVFQTYHLMVAMGMLMLFLCVGSLWLWKRGTLTQNRFMLYALVGSAALPQIANEAGWVSAEMGRYPWIVQDLLRISDGLSKAVKAEQVLASIILFACIYFLLFALFLLLLHEKFKHGPEEVEDIALVYHNLQKYVEEIHHASDTPSHS